MPRAAWFLRTLGRPEPGPPDSAFCALPDGPAGLSRWPTLARPRGRGQSQKGAQFPSLPLLSRAPWGRSPLRSLHFLVCKTGTALPVSPRGGAASRGVGPASGRPSEERQSRTLRPISCRSASGQSAAPGGGRQREARVLPAGEQGGPSQRLAGALSGVSSLSKTGTSAIARHP